MKIEFAGHALELHASGMVFWPDKRIGMVSDLHLEKGSFFAQRGFFLPPYDSQETLERLLKNCRKKKIERLIILGDCFHDAKGYDRMTADAKNLFNKLEEFQPVWIKGNHDKDFVPHNFSAYDQFELDDIIFRHQAIDGAVNEISGHFHPKIAVTHKGGHIERDCFICDRQKLMLPAFGAYTGGLSVENGAIRNLFGKEATAYILGENRVFSWTLI